MDDLLIGDAERDAAVESLTAAFVAGRITATELDQRTASALSARTETELSLPLAGLGVRTQRQQPPARGGPTTRTFRTPPTVVLGRLMTIAGLALIALLVVFLVASAFTGS